MSCEKGHNFESVKEQDGELKGYYKRDNGAGSDRDKSKVYAMLFCTKCGNTKEIVIVNYERN